MRDLLSKVMTGSMIAGAALLVSACGGSEEAATNNTANYTADESLMGNDITSVDAMNGTDANLGVDANVSTTTTTDTNTTTTTTDTGNTATDNTTGM